VVCGEIVDNLQQASLAVTTRLHAALLSARAGTPTVAVAYQPKVKHVLEDIGLSKSVVEMPNLAHDLPKHVLAAVREPQSYRLPLDRIDELDRMNRRVVTDVLQHLARQKDARTYRGTRPFSND
jgi:polysaccharide pyruvyl transferase WcaK-like protein